MILPEMRDTNSRTGIKGRVEYETDNWKTKH